MAGRSQKRKNTGLAAIHNDIHKTRLLHHVVFAPAPVNIDMPIVSAFGASKRAGMCKSRTNTIPTKPRKQSTQTNPRPTTIHSPSLASGSKASTNTSDKRQANSNSNSNSNKNKTLFSTTTHCLTPTLAVECVGESVRERVQENPLIPKQPQQSAPARAPT